MTKPRVKIKDWKIHHSDRRNGMELVGYAYDHYSLGTGQVWTSRIVNIDLDKYEVETLNTIYELEKP